MNLLFLTPQLPHPPRQGTAIRNWGLIKSLSARHAITLISFAEASTSPTSELQAVCKEIFTFPVPKRNWFSRLRALLLPHPDWDIALVTKFSSLGYYPDLAYRLKSSAIEKQISGMKYMGKIDYDAAIIEGLEMMIYWYCIKFWRQKRKPIIYDAHNAEYVIQARAYETDSKIPRRWPAALYSAIQASRLKWFEKSMCLNASAVTCVSLEDAKALRRLSSKIQPSVVPNGLFLSDYANNQLPITNNQLVFTGKMDYRPNVDAVLWFANDILPLIQRERPEAQLVIVGQKPTEAVQKLAERKGIVVTGAVDDVQPHIAGAAVYVAPLRMGGGTRFKLLEAMALKRPIVSTRIGAEGFEVQSGRELLLADSPTDFAQAVLTLLSDNAKQAALIGAAYEFVKRYDWGEIIPTVEAVLAKGKG